MSLSTGTRLGPYEVRAAVGAGGMGEVYRARDTKLGRDVALKVLPTAFATDAGRMARFQREAQVLASLNHPHIAHIYGLEESGSTRALVMELVEGPTLADRIAQGPIPLEEALPLAKQIAEAIEFAHEHGIIHRDLKPANVKVTPGGAAKVLDFGLAKALEGDAASVDPANSPTISVATTRAGLILGTAAYMAPEQARGRVVDRRADIWAFGCVLYEMLSGGQAFTGETVTDILAAVMKEEPKWDALPRETPAGIRGLLVRCLRKEPKSRLRDIGDARIAIEEALASPADSGAVEHAAAAPAKKTWHGILPWAVAGALIVGLGVALAGWWRASRPVDRPIVEFALSITPGDSLFLTGSPAVAVSPDGTHLCYVVLRGNRSQIYMRNLSRPEAVAVLGTEGADGPFFSPDGQWIAFFADGKLKKVPIAGGPTEVICEASANSRGGSWGPDGNVYAGMAATGGMIRVPATGGTVQPFTALDAGKDERTHRWPQALPDGKAVLFTVGTSDSPEFYEDAEIDAASVATGQRKVLLKGASMARYIPSGHLVYARGGQLFAAPFDLARLETTGPGIPLVPDVNGDPTTGAAHFSISNDGTLVYVPGAPFHIQKLLAWEDRTGKIVPLPAPPHAYRDFSLSPDGKRVAVGITAVKNEDIWIYNIPNNTLSRLTFDAQNQGPIWTPDGKRVIFSTSTEGPQLRLKWVAADGSSAAEPLASAAASLFAGSVSPDGRQLSYTPQNMSGAAGGVWLLPLEGTRKPSALISTPANEARPAFSPDGRWIAYSGQEGTLSEIFVQPYPPTGGRWQVSTDGGLEPLWSRDGRELFYRWGSTVMMVPVETKNGFKAGTPQTILTNLSVLPGATRNYAVNPDGRRILILKSAETVATPNQIHVLVNWFEELRKVSGEKK